MNENENVRGGEEQEARKDQSECGAKDDFAVGSMPW
jgi:hypothetical protein